MNPVRRVKPPKVPEELLEPVSLVQVGAMLRTCDRKAELGCRGRAPILALLDTGARASKMIALNVDDVDLGTGTVLLRCGKGRKPRGTFLGTRSLRVLIRYLRFWKAATGDTPLWATENGKTLQYTSLWDIIRRRASPVRATSSLRRTPRPRPTDYAANKELRAEMCPFAWLAPSMS